MKTVMVSGGAGFIGSHLCRFLLGKGYRLIAVDNFLTGDRENIADLDGNENFSLIEHDITLPLTVEEDVHYVLHFASPASPVDYLELPIQTLKVGALGTHNALGIARAKKAVFLLASTSEVYGDPLVHPQPESYWGNVNSVGPRGVYDEAKRFAEALTTAYRKVNKMDTKIARIFNSILGDQLVVLFNDSDLHLEKIESYVNWIEKNNGKIEHRILVPCFDPKTYKILLKEVSTVIKHEYNKDAFELSLAYGRKIKVTGDHSVFRRNKDGRPVAVPVREIKKGDHVAIPSKLPVIIKDVDSFNILQYLLDNLREDELWNYAVHSTELADEISINKDKICEILKSSGRINAKRYNNGIFCTFNWYRRQAFLPLYLFKKLNINFPQNSRIRVYKAGTHIYIPSEIKIDSDLLWLLGFYLAEGSSSYKKNKTYLITFSSDEKFLNRASQILVSKFNVHVVRRAAQSNKGPAIFAHSMLLHTVFKDVFKVLRENKNEDIRVPSWIFQLPLSKLKYFLEGYKDGDGTHSGKKLGKELCFDTKFEKFAHDLLMLLLRFGIVASLGKYKTKYRKKYGDRDFVFYRVTVCELSDFNILNWDKGTTQKLLARKTGDLVWAWVRNVKQVNSGKYVYDFSVPGAENFVAGSGVFCHNTFGPNMRKRDGRVVPNFITQALSNQPLTVYGNGKQTRSFCYISDLIDGIYRLMLSGVSEPVNLGNPEEHTILELAGMIKRLTGSSSELSFKPLPVDDPKTRCPDITKARNLLGWEPKIRAEDGLRKTIDWFREG